MSRHKRTMAFSLRYSHPQTPSLSLLLGNTVPVDQLGLCLSITGVGWLPSLPCHGQECPSDRLRIQGKLVDEVYDKSQVHSTAKRGEEKLSDVRILILVVWCLPHTATTSTYTHKTRPRPTTQCPRAEEGSVHSGGDSLPGDYCFLAHPLPWSP
jgi:hypothetical protein